MALLQEMLTQLVFIEATYYLSTLLIFVALLPLFILDLINLRLSKGF